MENHTAVPGCREHVHDYGTTDKPSQNVAMAQNGDNSLAKGFRRSYRCPVFNTLAMGSDLQDTTVQPGELSHTVGAGVLHTWRGSRSSVLDAPEARRLFDACSRLCFLRHRRRTVYPWKRKACGKHISGVNSTSKNPVNAQSHTPHGQAAIGGQVIMIV